MLLSKSAKLSIILKSVLNFIDRQDSVFKSKKKIPYDTHFPKRYSSFNRRGFTILQPVFAYTSDIGADRIIILEDALFYQFSVWNAI